MTAHAEKVIEKPGHDKVAAQTSEKSAGKLGEKPLEKRRALGRGLESLLPSKTSSQYPVTGTQQKPETAVTETDGAQLPTERAGESRGVEEPIPITISQLHAETGSGAGSDAVVEIPLDEIDVNPYQTRTHRDEQALNELAASIKVQGVIQPIVVRPAPYPLEPMEGTTPVLYILILGERRYQASRMLGKKTIPAIVKRVSEQQAAEMTVIENLQRLDLNCMDQAQAFKNLSEKFGLTQEEIGKRVGVSRETVSNYLRLLRLPERVTGYLNAGELSYSHARALLVIEDKLTLAKMADRAVQEKMSVDKLEEVLAELQFISRPDTEEKRRGARWVDPNVRAAQRELERILAMKVRIRDRKGKGTIRIEYASLEDYDRVVALLRGKKSVPSTQ